jgi:hypothetical protein
MKHNGKPNISFLFTTLPPTPQFHLQRQRHNRLALMILLTKTLVVVAHELDPVMERVVKLLMFTVLFLAHFLTNAYYKCVIGAWILLFLNP